MVLIYSANLGGAAGKGKFRLHPKFLTKKNFSLAFHSSRREPAAKGRNFPIVTWRKKAKNGEVKKKHNAWYRLMLAFFSLLVSKGTLRVHSLRNSYFPSQILIPFCFIFPSHPPERSGGERRRNRGRERNIPSIFPIKKIHYNLSALSRPLRLCPNSCRLNRQQIIQRKIFPPQ